MTCDHSPPDRHAGEPPSACRACRRAKYRQTSTRPRRRRSVEVDGTVTRYVAIPRPLVEHIDRYADRHGVTASTATVDLLAAGAASVLVDDAIAGGSHRSGQLRAVDR